MLGPYRKNSWTLYRETLVVPSIVDIQGQDHPPLLGERGFDGGQYFYTFQIKRNSISVNLSCLLSGVNGSLDSCLTHTVHPNSSGK